MVFLTNPNLPSFMCVFHPFFSQPFKQAAEVVVQQQLQNFLKARRLKHFFFCKDEVSSIQKPPNLISYYFYIIDQASIGTFHVSLSLKNTSDCYSLLPKLIDSFFVQHRKSSDLTWPGALRKRHHRVRVPAVHSLMATA